MFELFKDGRSTNASIAQKLGMSVLTVAKKVNVMIREKIISIRAIPNPVKMGNHASAFIGLNVDIKRIDSICEHLKKIPNVNLMITSFGRFDLLLIVYFPDWELLENFAKNVLTHIDGIHEASTFIITHIISSADVNGKVSVDNMHTATSQPSLDNMDFKIIYELMEDGRPNYTYLAKKLNTSTSTISRRISSLVEEGFIKIVAIPSHRLDYLANAFIVINADYAAIDSICYKLAANPGVQLVMRVMNNYDILFGLNSPNREELYKFLKNEVATMDGVLKTETFILADFLYMNTNALLRSPIKTHIKTRNS